MTSSSAQDFASDAPLLALQRRFYLWTLAVLFPTTLSQVLFTVPHWGFLRVSLLLCTVGWAAIFILLKQRRIALQHVAWLLLLIGILLNEVFLVSHLAGVPQAPYMTFHGIFLTFAWALLGFGDRLGRAFAVGQYLLTVVTGLVFVLPLLQNGTLQDSRLAYFWPWFLDFTMIGPVFMVVVYALATISRDLMQRRIEALTQFVYEDALTGLPNRRAFQERLEKAAQRGSGTLMLVNLTDFVRVNDHLGQHAGDMALQTVARRWQENLSAGAHLSRIGGDEFALILPTTDAKAIQGQAAELLGRAKDTIELDEQHVTLQARVGVSQFPQHGQDTSTLSRAASLALEAARDLNPPVVTFNEALAAATERRRQILHALELAPARQELHLVYQPIFNLHTGEVQSAEALVRWRSALTPNPYPDEFIGVAEQAGRMHALGSWIMGAALKQMRAWWDVGVNVPRVNVNVSAQELLHPGYAERLLGQLREARLPASALELEITERSVLESDAVQQLRVLREAGVGVSIDDFGTGHSSLAWLHALPITCVKLDRRFTNMLGQDGAADRLSRTVFTLANSLDLEVVAEGIETHEQMLHLKELHCPLGQGFLFTKPLAPPDFEDFLTKQPHSDDTSSGLSKTPN